MAASRMLTPLASSVRRIGIRSDQVLILPETLGHFPRVDFLAKHGLAHPERFVSMDVPKQELNRSRRPSFINPPIPSLTRHRRSNCSAGLIAVPSGSCIVRLTGSGCSPAHSGRGSWTRTPNSCGAASTLIAWELAAGETVPSIRGDRARA